MPGYHKEAPSEFRGNVFSVSQKAGLIQIDTGQVLDVYFDDNTKVVNWNQPLNKLSKGTPIKIVYADRDGKRYATLVSVKPPQSVPENQRIKLEEVKKLWETKSAIIIDVRPPAKHAEGHIPYTLNIPLPKLDAELPKVAPDKNQLIVFYCEGPRRALTPGAVRRAAALGYTNVKGYIEGFPEWKKAGLPVAVSPKHIFSEMEKEMPFVLIDVRLRDLAEKEHLPGAVNIPLSELEKAKGEFPEKKNAPIYVYCAKDENAIKAIQTIQKWGYTNVAFIPGGVESWKKAGGKVESGKLAKKIVYVPMPRPGTFSVEEFVKLVKSSTMPDKYFILDVREPDEVQQGAFKFAKNIPLGELEGRLNEIPKDKVILVHCATGVRAEMAYNVLKRAGFNVYYVNANIEFEGDKFKIEPKD
jgi:rhodanese-related sulfurtransferase